ncbi:histidinolphosphatase [Mortierella alpina]|uniref:Histidinol-phosphatase n=1 Tax=Mortierella alpina TaxID=64518 RepID=A0A9P6M5T3_MORAP|nr:histidinolphosphatase [Mortierella alpina]
MSAMFSFHSHSGQFCMHATGTLEQVVQSAIQRHFTTYGLSEHMPRYKPEQLYPEEAHLTVADLEKMYDDFLQEAHRLQRQYASQICLLIGLETEYFDAQSIPLVQRLRQTRRVPAAAVAITTTTTTTISSGKEGSNNNSFDVVPLPQVQYIVGSLHHVHNIPLDFSQELYLKALDVVGQGSWETLFREYFNTQFEMLQGLEPEVVGHLDLVRIFFGAIKGHQHGHGHAHVHEQEQEHGNEIIGNRLTEELWTLVKRNVDFVIAYGGLFELNSRAWKKGLADAYPQRDILEYILSRNGRITLSDDSHGPNDVGMFYNPELKQYLQQMNVTEVYYLAPNGHGRDHTLDARYATHASAATGSFQHVHVRSIPLASLRFFEK